jgi:hypothetical protein
VTAGAEIFGVRLAGVSSPQASNPVAIITTSATFLIPPNLVQIAVSYSLTAHIATRITLTTTFAYRHVDDRQRSAAKDPEPWPL